MHFRRLLSVTEGKQMLPPKREERAVCRQALTDWIVPPVILPLFLLLLIVAVAVWRG